MNYALGSDTAFDSLVYGDTHPDTINYLRNQFSHYSDTLTQSARDFMQRGRELFEMFNGNDAIRFAREAVSRVTGRTEIRIDNVCSIFELRQMQQAGTVMQRWLMANPVVRKQYNLQQIDGYHGSYVDMEPGMIGDNHYDYRRVMDGIVQVTPDDWKIVQYLDELKEGDRDLLLDEKDSIISSWLAMQAIMELGKDDPTNPDSEVD